MLIDVKNEVENILNQAEWMDHFSVTRTGSIYILLRKNEIEYMPIRISNHLKKTAFYANKTFCLENLEDELLNIREYLDQKIWYRFGYREYYALNIILFLAKKNRRIYIDNTMSIFDESKMGLVFYQKRFRNRKRFDLIPVSISFQKMLRRLYSSGLISGHRDLWGSDLLVYVTKMGHSIKNEFFKCYNDLYWKETRNLDFDYIKIPPEVGWRK